MSENFEGAAPGHGTRIKLLVFSRAAVLKRFREIFAPMRAGLEITHLTDAAMPDAVSVKNGFYAAIRAKARAAALNDEEVTEIVQRCRTLRGLRRDRARSMVHAMYLALDDAIVKLSPDCIASQMVDEYVSHLVALIAERRGIGYFGFCAGYFPGTSLLLADAYGRPLRWQDVPPSEAEAALDKVQPQSFRQDYNLRSDYDWPRHVVAIARYCAKLLIHNALRHLKRDPLNLHYLQNPFIAERRRLADFPSSSFFAKDWQAQLGELRAKYPDRQVVYMPLSYFPEATIDYWVKNTRAIRYEEFIGEVVAKLEERFIVVVKEHIHMMGARQARFLQYLNGQENVVSVNPLEISNIVVEQCDAALLGSGSPGIEATLRGTPVVSFCDNAYWFDPAGAAFLDIDRPDSWNDTTAGAIAKHAPLDREGALDFVAACLQSSTRTLASNNPWPSLDPHDVYRLVRHLAGERASIATQSM